LTLVSIPIKYHKKEQREFKSITWT